jgi:hypothetical protein
MEEKNACFTGWIWDFIKQPNVTSTMRSYPSNPDSIGETQRLIDLLSRKRVIPILFAGMEMPPIHYRMALRPILHIN